MADDQREIDNRARLVAVMAETVKREYGAQGAVLDEDGEHIFIDGLDADANHVVFRYYVPPETWASLETFEQGRFASPSPVIELRPPEDVDAS